MTRFLLAGAAALGLLTVGALAQTSTSQTTTTVTPSVGPSSSTTYTTTNGDAIRADGMKTLNGRESTTTETTTSSTSYPQPPLTTTVDKTTDVVHGVAVDTVTTTQGYPPGTSAVPPMSTTSTTFHKAD